VNSAATRLRHVRQFLAALDRRFPQGIPLEYSAAIREELAPLVADAQLELLEDQLGEILESDLVLETLRWFH
jgi:hypothetical protein